MFMRLQGTGHQSRCKAEFYRSSLSKHSRRTNHHLLFKSHPARQVTSSSSYPRFVFGLLTCLLSFIPSKRSPKMAVTSANDDAQRLVEAEKLAKTDTEKAEVDL